MEGNIHSEEHAGIVPRSVKAILEQLEASDSEYTIRVSFLELCKYRKVLHALKIYSNIFNFTFYLIFCLNNDTFFYDNDYSFLL